MSGLQDARLRGWKSIAAYLGVTQSTTMRWAKHADFPVLRSSANGSVYAYPDELDGWLAHGGAIGAASPTDAPSTSPGPAIDAGATTPDRPARRPWLLIALAMLVAALAIGGAMLRQRQTPVAAAHSPEAARMLLNARQQMASRTPVSLTRAIAGFQAIILRFPDLPAGFTGLAESYLLSCEYASMPRAEAFAAARAAVRTALALAPADPDAHRIMGFLRYWTDRDIDRAIPDFEASVAGATPNILAPLWYGNALVDAGRVAAGVAQLDRALAMAPDSPTVITDRAAALWQAGDEEGALRLLDEVGRRFPQQSAAPGFSALFRLSRGDVKGYLRDAERWSALIGNPALAARIMRERAAETSGGDAAALRTLAAADPVPTPFWFGGFLPSAMAASQLGDRARLIAILHSPRIPGENWRPLRFPAESFRRWSGDSVVAPLLIHAFGASADRLWPVQPGKS